MHQQRQDVRRQEQAESKIEHSFHTCAAAQTTSSPTTITQNIRRQRTASAFSASNDDISRETNAASKPKAIVLANISSLAKIAVRGNFAALFGSCVGFVAVS